MREMSKEEISKRIENYWNEPVKCFELGSQARQAEIDALNLKLIEVSVQHPCYQLSKELEAENNNLRDQIDELVAALKNHNCILGHQYFDGEDRVVETCTNCDLIKKHGSAKDG
jgi:hypothetical protein